MKPSRRLDRRGSTAVEFALVGSLVFTFLLTTIDIGRYLGDQHALDYAAATAARYAAVNSATATSTSITTTFDTAASGLLGNCAGCKVLISYSPSNKVGATVTVSVTYPWKSVSPLTLLGSRSLSSSSSMVVLN